MKYFASIPMTDNHFQNLSALYQRTMGYNAENETCDACVSDYNSADAVK
jgi:hypothetical protein